MSKFIPSSRGARSLPFGSFKLNRQSKQANGLVGWWPGLGSRGTSTLRDLSSNNLNGTFTAGISWITDPFRGVMLDIDGGVDHYVEIAHNSVLNLTSQMSFSAWVRRDVAGSFDDLISKVNPAGGANGYWFTLRDDDFMQLSLADGTITDHISTNEQITDTGRLYHLAATVDGTNIRFYVDGQLDSTIAQVRNAGTNTTNLRIGDSTRFASSEFNGKLDDPRISNLALADAEVYQLWSPATRWDLYKPIPRQFAFNISRAGFSWPSKRRHPSTNVLLRL